MIFNSHTVWFLAGLACGGLGTVGAMWLLVSMGAETERERQIYERGGE